MNKTPSWSRNGTLARARQIASPNQDARPRGACVQLLVIHGISLPPGKFRGSAVEKLFTNRLDHEARPGFSRLRDLRVSAHFLIRRGGALLQFVACDRRAWHAGVSVWAGRERCNDFSIGIELEGTDHLPYTEAQYRQLARLSMEILDRYPITGVLGHSEIAPGRKTDPGPGFSWGIYRAMVESRSQGRAIPGFPAAFPKLR
ncbi:MAG: 1,6-anhydro-N-acetylmuramyl-L-alanine amidase AmpD [Betaproteobacteria bacterium]|nr:1,6-anhydro-N-acetylmuramyl-L-alanine amidase AmpD [Betaproteobacteria bacterium]